MKAVLVKAPGDADQMYIGEAEIPSPKSTEVLIKVEYTAINRADIIQRQGKYPIVKGESPIMGLEIAGEIIKIGNEVKHWNIKDKVMALVPGGGYAEYCVADEGALMKIPSHLSTKQACSIPETWLAAYQLLRTIGCVQKDEYVLIHAGASGVGVAAIQLCNLFGAKAIATSGSNEKVQFCTKLGAALSINYKTSDFSEVTNKFLQQNNCPGVDLILDCVGASHFQKNLLCTKDVDSRWILYGLLGGGEIDKFNLSSILRRRIQLTGTMLRTRSQKYKSQLVHDFTTHALPYFNSEEKKREKTKT